VSFPPGFLTFEFGFHILGALMGSFPFVESFVLEVLQEEFNIIVSLPMFADPQTAFAMLSFCYA
jgi:hypothetical protein